MAAKELIKKADEYREKLLSTGWNKAFKYIFSLIRNNDQLSEDIIKSINFLLYNKTNPASAGEYRTGDIMETPPGGRAADAGDIPRLMGHYIGQIETSKGIFHPVEYAALCFKRLLDICPFENGNEATALFVMNLMLMREGYPVVSIPLNRRDEFNAVMNSASNPASPETDRLVEFVAELVCEAQEKETVALSAYY